MAPHGLWLWLLINLPRNRNSFLWVMERNPPVYFFGTIHVPYTKVWEHIPLNTKQAFVETDHVYFELDLTDPVIQATLAQCQILPKGVILREVIPRTLYKRIRRHLSYIRKMMPVWMTPDQKMVGLTPLQLYLTLTKNWYKKRPIWIMLLLNALTEYDTKGRGISVLDTFLIRAAVSRNKGIGSIESVEEQCEPLNALNNSQVIVALNQTLLLHEKIRRGKAKLTYSTKDLIYHYNCGDLMDVLFTQDMSNLANLENSSVSNTFAMQQTRQIDQYLRAELIYKRNRRMAKRVVQIIKNEPNKSFFFAFGAGHFLGNGSIIDILANQGYKVSHVHPDASLPRYGPVRKVKNNSGIFGKKYKGKRKRRRRKRHKRRRQRVRMNVDNLWKRDPSWKPNTRPGVFEQTSTRPVHKRKIGPSMAQRETSFPGRSGSSSVFGSYALLWATMLTFML